jgi:D-alanine-D-alanine ligase
MNAPRVAVLMGGLSDEHDVSIASGKKALSSLEGKTAFGVVIQKDGVWIVDGERMGSIGKAIDRMREKCDVAFLALHGPFGEDGTIQGLLEVAGIPYTGSGVMASALAMDKPRTKMVYRHRGLNTPDFFFIEKSQWNAELRKVLEAAPSNVGFPCVVKPARQGSSVGISFPKNEHELDAAVTELFKTTTDVIVERFVKGRELTCGVLAVDRESRVFALPPTEIIPGDKFSFFDYTAKYTPGASEEITPARITPEQTKEVQRMALAAHEMLGCRDFSRSDFMLGLDDRIYILETNTIPGLTPTSLLPQGAAAIGIEYATLIGILIDNAWGRRR